MKNSTTFITLGIVFIFGAFTVFTVNQLKVDVFDNFTEFNELLNHTNVRLSNTIESTNDMLLSTSARVTAIIDKVEALEKEVFTTILLSSEATSNRIDSLLLDLNHKVSSVKGGLPSILK